MQSELYEQIEKVLDEKVRPTLHRDGGDIEIVGVEEGTLKVRFIGRCQNCPSASLTLEAIVGSEVIENISEIEKVVLVTGVSNNTLEMAYAILKSRREGMYQ